MKNLLLIICLLVSVPVFCQQKTTAKDSVAVISMQEFTAILERLNVTVQRQFDQSAESAMKYQAILREMQAVLQEQRKKHGLDK